MAPNLTRYEPRFSFNAMHALQIDQATPPNHTISCTLLIYYTTCFIVSTANLCYLQLPPDPTRKT